MMVLQHTLVRKSLLWHLTILNANVGVFSLSYAVISSSVLFIDSYFILKFNILVVICFSNTCTSQEYMQHVRVWCLLCCISFHVNCKCFLWMRSFINVFFCEWFLRMYHLEKMLQKCILPAYQMFFVTVATHSVWFLKLICRYIHCIIKTIIPAHLE